MLILNFPDEPIKRMGPNENHGTYEFFWENILEEQDLAEGIKSSTRILNIS